MKSTVYIICGVHNGLDHTKKLLSCIKKQTYYPIKTFIIDDGSTDGTCDYIQQNYPEINVTRGSGKLWWTGTLFLGIEEVQKIGSVNDFVFTINNDCEFDKDLITILVETSTTYERAIVSSLAIDSNSKNRIWDAGIQIDWIKGKFFPLSPKEIKDLPKDSNIQDKIDTLTTKGTLYPIEIFQKIGNFDKKHLPHYASDYEFACRAKKSGFKLILSYEARVYNDIKRTGFGENIRKQISIGQYFSLLFSRRSRINIFDRLWFITLCCPNKFKFKNYISALIKAFLLFFLIFPFFHKYKTINIRR